MRRSLIHLLAGLLAAASAEAQVLDDTMVPAGRLRLQAHPAFMAWDQRFGRAPDGTDRVESLGDDLTDPTGRLLFPGLSLLQGAVRDVTGLGSYEPTLGSAKGFVTQNVTRIDFGGHLGVFDWLTVGVVVPWMQTRTAIDAYFQPDPGADLGINPRVTGPSGVTAFLASTAAADAAAQSNAASTCAGGASPECSAAQSLAARADAFDAALQAAYGASPLFPTTGSAAGTALAQAAADLSADLSAAGLAPLTTLQLAGSPLSADGFASLPTLSGAGFDASPLGPFETLWGTGDVELTARIRVLDNMNPASDAPSPDLGYRVTVSGLVRLPTGTPEDPSILFDLGAGDAQTDIEGGLTALLTLGSRLGLAAGGRYGIQQATTVFKRVAPLETALPPASTLRELTWRPGFYLEIGVAPMLRLGEALTVAGEYRFFHKGRDQYELTVPDVGVDPVVLALESGVKAHVVGGGLRYDTVEPWKRGDASRPMEVHLRLLTAVAGSGGHVPKQTRVEAGIRLFRRIWGAS